MTSSVLKKTKEELVVEWSGNKGFGVLAMKYDGKGGFNIDAEYMGIDSVLEILRSVETS